MSGSTRGAGTAVTAGEVPQLKVVSGRHLDTRKRPVGSGYSVANPWEGHAELGELVWCVKQPWVVTGVTEM